MEDIHNWQSKFESCEYAERLLNKLTRLNQQVKQPIDIDEVKKGIYYAKKYHGSQMRQSGEPYYSHPIEVAYMVAQHTALEMPQYFRTDMIITSLLHDTIEDTALTKTMIDSIFGSQVANQVEDLTRVKVDRKISAAETVELLWLQKKYDVLIIKLFDRIHNVQTIGVKSPEKIKKIIEETLSRFMSLSIYLGTPKVEQILARLCFKNMQRQNDHQTLHDNFRLPSLVSQSKISQIHNLLP
ncbi:MAG: HD domain-containing protein [Rickettsia endosymbiont of Culicoides impunctatus]|uniref:HD domain-containing protein n=1 Tax=unclassified Candidatus Tisiphia TaxID=2996318 RepID=UPI001E776577|nr:MAG: HD domain-containing protein [Rickettsia endosymbiont of Culicoides impunctatus]